MGRMRSCYHDSNTFIAPPRPHVSHGERKMKTTRLFLALAVLSLAAIPLLASPVKADTTGNTGQPNQSCQAVFPNGQFTPPGFNTDGFNSATLVYAGSGQTLQTPANPAAVSQ